MYSTCLYCHRSFGANAALETFPVGRRLAFDQARGRLWVVCRACEKWSLAPFDERWEALEDCERLFRDARKRVTSDQIGLARLDEGLELVRIGEPLRPEFAAWRYGDQFGRRRRKALAVGTVATVGVAALATGSFWLGAVVPGGTMLFQGVSSAAQALHRRRVAVILALHGSPLVIRNRHLDFFTPLSPRVNGDDFAVRVVHDGGEMTLTGASARYAAARVVPRVNRSGAGAGSVRRAVGLIERAGSPDEFLRTVWLTHGPGVWARKDWSTFPFGGWQAETRVAVEMALNEERERFALEGELALLELEWKEAEEIASIADKLAIPEEVEQHLARLRREMAK